MWYSGAETLDISPTETFTAAEFNYKQLAGNVTITGLEEIQNSGKEAIHNLLKSRIRNLEKSMKNTIATALYANGTGSSSKEVGGLQLLVADIPTNTVGGISGNSYPWWKNYVYDFSDNTETPSTTTIQHAMNLSWINTVRGSDQADIITADANYYLLYLEIADAHQRFTDDKGAGAGFTNLVFQEGAGHLRRPVPGQPHVLPEHGLSVPSSREGPGVRAARREVERQPGRAGDAGGVGRQHDHLEPQPPGCDLRLRRTEDAEHSLCDLGPACGQCRRHASGAAMRPAPPSKATRLGMALCPGRRDIAHMPAWRSSSRHRVAGDPCAGAGGQHIGVAQNAIPSGEYGWVAINGHSLRVNTLAAEGVGVTLYTTDTAGALADATASGSAATIFGLTLVATASGTTASSAACIMQNPVVRKTIVDA